jgi:drug/metabolite transporter (DMT)-like permease
LKPSAHLAAILKAVFVTFLWSTSWVLIKLGLEDSLPAITFAGLRYGMAVVCLTPLVLFNTNERASLKALSRADWSRLALLGLIVITLTQGAQFLSLAYLPAAMVNLVYNVTPVVVGLAGFYTIKESPSPRQWLGIGLTALGVGAYFLPVSLLPVQRFGLLVALTGMLTNAAAALLAREINRTGHITPLIVTFVSMGLGSGLLLLVGIGTQGFGRVSWVDWAIIVWMAVVNTALAFTIWNRTLRTISAIESSILNSLMLPQVALLAVFFLGEGLTVKEIVGLVLVGIGVIVVQLRQRSR